MAEIDATDAADTDAADTARLADALEQGAGARRLDDQLVLEVRGEDAHDWLNGQVTNAVATTTPGDAVYALFTTVKGKILADAWILHVEHQEEPGQQSDTLWAVVPAESRQDLLESFDKYIVMEDVEITPREDLAVLTVQGPKAAGMVEGLVAASETPGVTAWPCDRLAAGGRDLIVPADRADALLSALTDAGAAAVTEEAWELARLRRAVPRFGRDFSVANYPQEAGLTERAVSFRKGCYVGQEVVCMLQTRGKLSKKLVSLSAPAGQALEPGVPLRAGGKDVGRVTSVAPDPGGDGADGAVRALGWVKAAHAEPGSALSAGETPCRVVGEAR